MRRGRGGRVGTLWVCPRPSSLKSQVVVSGVEMLALHGSSTPVAKLQLASLALRDNLPPLSKISRFTQILGTPAVSLPCTSVKNTTPVVILSLTPVVNNDKRCHFAYTLKVHKREKFFGSDFEFFTIL